MKHLIALSAIVMAFSVNATTSNFQRTLGHTSVSGIGSSESVKVINSVHTQNSGSILNGSQQVETVNGKVDTNSATQFVANTAFSELSANLNGADFGYDKGQTVGASVTNVNSSGTEKVVIERDNWQWSPVGGSDETYREVTKTTSAESAAINSNYVTDYVGYRAYQ